MISIMRVILNFKIDRFVGYGFGPKILQNTLHHFNSVDFLKQDWSSSVFRKKTQFQKKKHFKFQVLFVLSG